MKRLIVGLMAASAIAIAAPAFAHDDGDANDNGDDEVYAAETYQDFTPIYQHVWQGIQHGVSDESYTSYQARRFYRELQGIRYRASWEERSGQYDPQDINYRLQALHDRMHITHQHGHDRVDQQYNNDWNGGRRW